MEKAARYKSRGIDLLTVEKKPSLQNAFQMRSYSSFETGDFHLPLRGPVDLAMVIIKSFNAVRKVRRLRPFAIYAYNQDPENIITGLFFKLILRRPLVIVYHHITKLTFAPLGAGIATRRRMGYGLVSSVWLSVVPALNRVGARMADLHLALSVSTKNEVEAWAGVENCVVVGNGVDSNKFRQVQVKKNYDAAFLGRIVPQKGIGTLIRAWSIVAKRRPGSRLALIGGGDPEQIREFKTVAEGVGVLDGIEFMGFLSDEEMIRTLNSSRLFVFPSTKEGFAQAVSQAMACGLCCIISDIPSLRETYGEVAMMVPPGNPESLAEKISALLGNDAMLLECGVRSRQFVQKFSWDSVVDKELSALKNLSDFRDTKSLQSN